MNTEREIVRVPIEIPRDQAIRYLGMHRGDRAPNESVLQVLEEELAFAAERIEPVAVVRSFPEGVQGSAFFEASRPLALVVCTIGPALEARIDELFAAEDALRAMILDGIGSAAVEEVADRCNQRICEEALQEGLRPDRRGSPGYGKWAIQEQRWIFEQLGPEEIGVQLTESCLMMPQKSISLGVPLTGGEDAPYDPRRCVRCGLLDCAFREV